MSSLFTPGMFRIGLGLQDSEGSETFKRLFLVCAYCLLNIKIFTLPASQNSRLVNQAENISLQKDATTKFHRALINTTICFACWHFLPHPAIKKPACWVIKIERSMFSFIKCACFSIRKSNNGWRFKSGLPDILTFKTF